MAVFIGAIAHGFQMPEKMNLLLWLFLAGFSASVGEWKPVWYKKSVIGMSLAAIIFIGITVKYSSFTVIKSIHFTIIWEFDFNGAFHLVQMLAGIFLGLGIIGVMKSASSSSDMTERENDDIPGEATGS